MERSGYGLYAESSCIGECNARRVWFRAEQKREGEEEKERRREAPRNEGSEDENGTTLASDGDLFLDLPVSSK